MKSNTMTAPSRKKAFSEGTQCFDRNKNQMKKNTARDTKTLKKRADRGQKLTS